MMASDAAARAVALLIAALLLAMSTATAIPHAAAVYYDSEAAAQIVVPAVLPSALPRCSVGGIELRVLVNSRHVASCPTTGCRVRLVRGTSGASGRSSSIAVYSACGSNELQLLGVHGGPGRAQLPPMPHPAYNKQNVPEVAAVPLARRPRVMLYNTVENTPFAQSAAAVLHATGAPMPTIESIVRSNGSQSCSGGRPGGQGGACGVYHATPTVDGAVNYYCWWRRRGNASAAGTDCANITQNARYLAQLWHTTGIDVIVPDTTNIDRFDDPSADQLNIRPVETMLEEFISLRSQGIVTPGFAIWTTAATNSTMYKGMLPLVNNPEFAELWLRTAGGKVVYFTHSDDASVVAAIEAGGNVNAIQMWAILSKPDADNGTFSFFQPCQASPASNNFTISIRTDDPSYRCNHLLSAAKVGGIGTQMSLAMSWQNSQCSMSWAAPSKLMGATFRAQVDDALRARPDNIMLPSYDEWTAGHAPIPAAYQVAQYTVGFPPWDQNMSFVDTFGAERSRTWAPSVESGDFYLRLTQSCIRVLALTSMSPPSPDDPAPCNVAGELCCDRQHDKWTPIWSLRAESGKDFLVTADESEKTRLVQEGGWDELCASSFGAAGTDTFCYTMAMQSFAARQGPFLLYTSATPPPLGTASLLHTHTARFALYRCVSAAGLHFISTAGGCGGEGAKQESLLGYASAAPHTGMPRRLWGCAMPTGTVYHALDADCLVGDTPTALGWVM